MGSSDQAGFQPIHNPYIVGNPIKEQKMFFGREDDFAFIRNQVSGAEKGGLLVLCGGRRSGKTSILFQVTSGRLGPDFLPVLLDMQVMAVDNDLDFLIKVGQGIVEAVGDPGLSLEKDFLGQPEDNNFAKFERFINRVNELLGDKKLVLLFDEYEIFESHIDDGLISTAALNLLANWIEHKGGAFVVFTGSDRLDERTAEYWQTFLTKALYRGVSYLSKDDTLRLIKNPVEGDVQWEDGVPEQIWALTAGQPFYTQVYCRTLVDHLNERRGTDVESEDVREVTDEIIDNPLPQMIFSWNSLLPMEKVALSIIGELSRDEIRPITAKDIVAFAGKEKIGYDIDIGKLNETLEKLFHHDLLAKDEQLAYTFRMDLWRQWIGRMHSIWQVGDELAAEEVELGEGLTKSRPRRRALAIVAPAVVAIAAVVFALVSRNNGAGDGPLVAVPVDSATVTIRTEPPGAWVYLNERRIDRSPVEGFVLAAGAAMMRIEHEGYKDIVDSLVLAKDAVVDTSFNLVRRVGTIAVSSSPAGAEILVSGERTGLETPSTLQDLSVLEVYSVAVQLPSYAVHEWPAVRVFEDSTTSLSHAFSKLSSQLTVESDPSGAEILVDGVMMGQTPAVFGLEYGRHQVTLRLAGYAIFQTSIDLASSAEKVEAALTKLPPGKLILKVLPYADIHVNGELQSRQQSRYEATLDTGRYEIELHNKHFGNRTVMVDIVSGQTTEQVVDLRSNGESQ